MKPSRRLQPAELRDGCYVQPFDLLEPDQFWCGRREVWTSTYGRATRYHVMVDGGVAACRPDVSNTWRSQGVILICEDTLVPIAKVPSHMCCLRNGCRQLYEAFLG